MTNLPAILRLDLSKPQYERGSLNLSPIDRVAARIGLPPNAASLAQRCTMRLECLAIGLRALGADSIANELDEIANDIGKLPISSTKPVSPAGLRDSLSKLPPVPARRA